MSLHRKGVREAMMVNPVKGCYSLRPFQAERKEGSPLRSTNPTIQQQIDEFERHLDQLTRYYSEAMTVLVVHEMLQEFDGYSEAFGPIWQVQRPRRVHWIQSIVRVVHRLWAWGSTLAKLMRGARTRSASVFPHEPIIIDVDPSEIIDPGRVEYE